MLDISDIHLLKVVSETGSLNKAAKQLSLSQPTLSKRLLRLEQALNVELFHRHSGGVKPTAISDYLIQGGEQLQTRMDAMCRHVALLSKLEAGSLNIGVSPIAEPLFFPQLLLDFIQQTHNVEISLRVERPDRLLQAVEEGEIDIAIGPNTDQQTPPELFVTPLQPLPMVFVARPEHPLANQPTPVSIPDLQRFPTIGPVMNQTVIAQLEKYGAEHRLQVTCDNYQITKSVVMASDHISGGPARLFAKELQQQELITIPTTETLYWRGHGVIRIESLNLPTVKRFLGLLKHYSDRFAAAPS